MEAILETRDNLKAVDKSLESLSGKKLEDVASQLHVKEKATLSVGMAFSLASLFYISAAVNGTLTNTHAVHTDLGRIKSMVAKINDVGKEPDKRKVVVNTAAAQHMILHHINGNEKPSESDQIAERDRLLACIGDASQKKRSHRVEISDITKNSTITDTEGTIGNSNKKKKMKKSNKSR